jgi:hypothetical protein
MMVRRIVRDHASTREPQQCINDKPRFDIWLKIRQPDDPLVASKETCMVQVLIPTPPLFYEKRLDRITPCQVFSLYDFGFSQGR